MDVGTECFFIAGEGPAALPDPDILVKVLLRFRESIGF